MKTIITLSSIVLTALIFLGNKKPLEQNAEYKSSFPTIIDTLHRPALDRERYWMSQANYPILYIGKEKDTIVVNRMSKQLSNYIFYSWDNPDKYKYCAEVPIQIEICNAQVIKVSAAIEADELWDYILDTTISDTEYFKAYPVILRHSKKKSIIIGHTTWGEEIPFILEALDSLGNWREIEERPTYLCGTGIYPILLPPNEIVLTAVKIYKGSFKTTLRLKIGTSYSAPFSGSINYRQFNRIFNEDGDYTDEYKNTRKQRE